MQSGAYYLTLFNCLYIKEPNSEYITTSGISEYTTYSNNIQIKFWFSDSDTKPFGQRVALKSGPAVSPPPGRLFNISEELES